MDTISAGPGHSRAQFLRRGALGTMALVGGGSILATMKGDAFAQSGELTDADIATFAASAELLAVKVYGTAISSGLFKGGSLSYLRNARRAEKAHYDALAGVLGSSAPKSTDFEYSLPRLRSVGDVLDFAIVLETAFLGAYLAAVKELDDPALKVVAAQIAANEASHLGFFKNARKAGSVVPAIPKTGDLAKIVETVGTLQRKKA